MDIKILHDADWKFATYFSTNYVMERTRQKSKFENIDIIRYFLIRNIFILLILNVMIKARNYSILSDIV